ncbi:MAG: hypothetical protein IKA87_07025 [Lentisphaeria bacterium]|nr:hypothetical protein [Lentisphaeria bacterium]
MNLKDAINALLTGGSIPDVLRQQLAELDPESLITELNGLRTQLDEQENAKLTAEELLKKQLAEALSERDDLQKRHRLLERHNRIRELAEQSGCEDPEYLDFLAERQGVDLEDSGAAAEFIDRAARRSPHCFRTALNPGSGSGITGSIIPHLPENSDGSDRIGRIIRSLGSAPAVK